MDFDGVIADTESIFARFDCDLINETLGTSLTASAVRNFAGMGGDEKLRTVAEDHGLNSSDYIDSFLKRRRALRKTLFKDSPPEHPAGLMAFLDRYKNHYALATNKERHKIEVDLECMALTKYFADCLFCFEGNLQKKPAPDILLAAMTAQNMDPATTIYIGDNTIDMQAALKAGITPIGFVFGALLDVEDRKKRLIDAGAQLVVSDLECFLQKSLHSL